jgi:acetolactate decarboxylase
MLDRRLVTALHLESLRHSDLAAEHEPHVIFQASTVGAMLEGSYDGDVAIGEIAEHGDLGIGTLNAVDGEMIVVDGSFWRADIEGRTEPIDPQALTPFAVVTWFEPTMEFELEGAPDDDAFRAVLDERLPADAAACALRIDGEFAHVKARSIPRQDRPYPTFAEVVVAQHVFEFERARGTLVGFRFPDYAEGLEVSGYHLHFISDDRSFGGHVLSCVPNRVRVQVDPTSALHVELPPGVDLAGAELEESTREALRRAEHD